MQKIDQNGVNAFRILRKRCGDFMQPLTQVNTIHGPVDECAVYTVTDMVQYTSRVSGTFDVCVKFT